MSSPVKVGHALLEIHRGNDDRLHLVASGYGREPVVVATFLGDREAALSRALLARGVKDIAPVIWETGEHATDEQRSSLFALPVVGTRTNIDGKWCRITAILLADGTVWTDERENPPVEALAHGYSLYLEPESEQK